MNCERTACAYYGTDLNQHPLDHMNRAGWTLVDCDYAFCGAEVNPMTEGEILIAYHHWRSHPKLGGCSHGR